jgi:hypothetical protein
MTAFLESARPPDAARSHTPRPPRQNTRSSSPTRVSSASSAHLPCAEGRTQRLLPLREQAPALNGSRCCCGRGGGVRHRATDARLAPASARRQHRLWRYRVPCKGALRREPVGAQRKSLAARPRQQLVRRPGWSSEAAACSPRTAKGSLLPLGIFHRHVPPAATEPRVRGPIATPCCTAGHHAGTGSSKPHETAECPSGAYGQRDVSRSAARRAADRRGACSMR